MIVPDTINLNIYKSIFTFAIQSDTDDTLTYGKFKNYNNPEKTKRMLDLNEDDKIETIPLEFYINVTKHTPRYIQFELNFTNLNVVSSGINKD